MFIKNQLKQAMVSLRIFMLCHCNPVIRFYYKYLWQPKPDSVAHILDEFSKRKEKVFFLQVGSNDGFQHDPLCKFIKRDAWNGILMEPQKSAFSTLEYIYKNNDVSPTNMAVDKHVQQRKLYKIAFSEARWATGLSSFNRDQLLAMIESGHIERQCNKYGIEMPADPKDVISYDLIDCISFEQLIKNHAVQNIDLIHIDTEGYDFEILKLFPFGDFLPEIVIFEHSHLSKADLEGAKALLQEKGYKLNKFGADTIGQREVLRA